MLAILLLALISAGLAAPDPVSVNLYVMSQCPYAAFLVQSLQQSTFSAAGVLGISNITFDYIAKVDPSQPTGFDSKHGQNEVLGDFYELCVRQIQPLKLWDFVSCADKNPSSIPSNLQACAQQTGVSWSDVQKCYDSDRTNLLKSSILRTDSLGVTMSPTLFVNGQCLYGGLSSCTNVDPSSNMILKAICAAWTGTKPSGCSQFKF